MEDANLKKKTTSLQTEYTRPMIFGRLALSFTQTALDYIYAILASFEVEAIRGVLIMFLGFYPLINLIAWSGILGYLDLKYNNGIYHSIRDLFGKNWKRNLKTAFVFGVFQIFNLLPFYIYIKIYKDHNAIFTEELVDLLELDKQNKRTLIDEEKSFATFKTMKTIGDNNNNNNNHNHLNINQNNTQTNMGAINLAVSLAAPPSLPHVDKGYTSNRLSETTPLASASHPKQSILTHGGGATAASLGASIQRSRPSPAPKIKLLPVQQSINFNLNLNSSTNHNLPSESDTPIHPPSGHRAGGGGSMTPALPLQLITENDFGYQQSSMNNMNMNSMHAFKKRIGIFQEMATNARMSLKTQIAIEANCKFSLFTIVEEQNFQMLFEAGEIMEMAFKSFPMFAIQLCNNILQNNWALYWFTILYFCILIIRLLVIGFIFVRFILLNDRMIKFLESIRYFNEEMAGDNKQTANQRYPMPESLAVNQIKTLKRITDLSEDSSSKVTSLMISIVQQPKNADLIIRSLNSSIQKFLNLTKVSLNLSQPNVVPILVNKSTFSNNKFGSSRISDVTEFLIQSLVKCTEVALFFDGNDLNEEDLNMIKSKFDRAYSYESFYFQSEQMVIIFDQSRRDILSQLQMFYRRVCLEDEEFHEDMNYLQPRLGSMHSFSAISPDRDLTANNNPADRTSVRLMEQNSKMKQLYIISPNHAATPEEQRLLMRILTEVQINYVEIEINFEDSTVLSKLQSQVDNMKFHMGFIVSKHFSFFKNGKVTKVQTPKLHSFEFSMPIEPLRDVRPLSIIGAKGLSKALIKFNRLFDLSILIPDNLIANHGLIALSDSLPNHCKNLKLDLSNNMLGDMGSMALSQKLAQMMHLTSFSLSLKENKFLSATSLDLISESISKILRLKEFSIDLSGMELSNRSLNKFFSRLQNSKGLEIFSINLRDNRMDPVVQLVVDMNRQFGTSEKQQHIEKGSYNLSKTLENMALIKALTLNISQNSIDSSGSTFITKALGGMNLLTNLNLNLSENYIKKNGVLMLSQNLKKLSCLEIMDLILDNVKKPNTNQRRLKKHQRGEQRMDLDRMMKSESKPLKAIFKKIGKFNRSLKELKKYVNETITHAEEKTLQRYIKLSSKDKDINDLPEDKISKDMIMKLLADMMDSNMRTYQMTARKHSSFEDLFLKLRSLSALISLRLHIKQNGIVNLDMEMLGESLLKMNSLQRINLNFSENVITDAGVKLFFTFISQLKSVVDIQIDLSSNVIKVEGAEFIARSIETLVDRVKMAEKEIEDIEQRKKDTEMLKNIEDQAKKAKQELAEADEVRLDFGDRQPDSDSPKMSSSEQPSPRKQPSASIEKRLEIEIPPSLGSFQLNIRNNKIDYEGGFALVEMACKLRDSNVNLQLLMGNCGIVAKQEENEPQDKARYGFFLILKKELGSSFEYE